MTRTYERQTITYDRTLIDVALADGIAKAFETAKGTFYVLKTDQGTFKVTQDQILDADYEPEFDPDAAYERFLETRYSDEHRAEEAVERANGALDYYEAKAAAEGISVGEYTDGEYESFGPDSAAEAALLAKFGL